MWNWVGYYGPYSDQEGILSEHLGKANLPVRKLAGGKQVTIIEGQAVKVLCSEVIEISTEDGPASGRCGLWVEGDNFACVGHQAQIDAWHAESPLVQWEREQEEVRYCGF